MLAALALIFSVVRQPGSALDNPWAEDGTIFLNAAYRLPWWHVLLLSYNGYVSVYPSSVALVAAAGPVRLAAVVLALGGGLATACAVFVTVLASGDHIRSVVIRLLLGVGVGAFPLAGAEIAANSCNAQWYLLLASFWCVLWRPRGIGGRALILVVPFLSAGTDPLTGLLLPIAALRLLAGPRHGRQALLGNLPSVGLVAGLLLQASTLLRPSLHPVSTHPTVPVLFGTWLYKAPDLALLGPTLAQRAGWWGFGVSCGALLLAVAVAVRGGHGPLAVVGLAMSAVLFVVPSYLRWLPSNGIFSTFAIQTRYAFAPWALALLVFALAADGYARSERSGSRNLLLPALLAVVICVPAALNADSGRSRVPSWIHEVRKESAVCRTALQPAGGTDVDARLVVAPRASYVVHVPCRRL